MVSLSHMAPIACKADCRFAFFGSLVKSAVTCSVHRLRYWHQAYDLKRQVLARMAVTGDASASWHFAIELAEQG